VFYIKAYGISTTTISVSKTSFPSQLDGCVFVEAKQ